MELPLTINFSILNRNDDANRRTVTIPKNGLLTFVGPNGSGKSHLLRGIKRHFNNPDHCAFLQGKAVHFLPAGRLGELENYRINQYGLLNPTGEDEINYKSANLRTKSHSSFKYSMESIAVDYQRLKDRADIQLRVRARLRESFKRDIRFNWGSDGLEVEFEYEAEKNSSNVNLEYNIGQEASGLVHLVGLLSALYNDEIGVLIIDEPELSMHPQYQNFLLQVIRKVCGMPTKLSNQKIIIIATHSPEFITLTHMEDLYSFCLCEDITQNPIQVLELQNGFKSNTLIQRIGYQYKKALFAKVILLVEGETDEIICRVLATQMDFELESSGAQIVAIGSKDDFIAAHDFFRAIRKSVYILADIDWLVDRPDIVNHHFNGKFNLVAEVNDILSTNWKNSDGMLRQFKQHSYGYGRFRAILSYVEKEFITKNIKVNTLALIEWLEKDQNNRFDEREIMSFSVALKRVSFCKLLVDHSRMNSVLDQMGQEGIFVLRRGEIESYYVTKRVPKKRRWAFSEYEALLSMPFEKIIHQYHDIIAFLEFGIDEKENIELSMLHDALSILVIEFFNYFQKDQPQNIERLTKNTNQEGIFSVRFNSEKQSISIRLKSTIFELKSWQLVMHANDDLKATKAHLDDIFRKNGLVINSI